MPNKDAPVVSVAISVAVAISITVAITITIAITIADRFVASIATVVTGRHGCVRPPAPRDQQRTHGVSAKPLHHGDQATIDVPRAVLLQLLAELLTQEIPRPAFPDRPAIVDRVPEPARTIVLRATDLEPARRYESAERMGAALRQLLAPTSG